MTDDNNDQNTQLFPESSPREDPKKFLEWLETLNSNAQEVSEEEFATSLEHFGEDGDPTEEIIVQVPPKRDRTNLFWLVVFLVLVAIAVLIYLLSKSYVLSMG